jgi:hypothetical protein
MINDGGCEVAETLQPFLFMAFVVAQRLPRGDSLAAFK